MTIKVLMVDVGGVIVAHPHPQDSSANLEKDLGLARQTLQARFSVVHLADIVRCSAALRDACFKIEWIVWGDLDRAFYREESSGGGGCR
jgi:hypothetical protein